MNREQVRQLKEVHLSLTKKIKHLHVATKYNVATKFMGDYPSVFKGRGIEFADFRQYTPADDASQIDWLHSLKGGKLLVREYVEERNLTIMFVVDCSNTMLFGSQEKLKHEYAAELTAAVAAGALESGDAVGMCLASDKIKRFIRPMLGLKQLELLLHALVNEKNYGGESAFGEIIGRTSNALPRNRILILVSDFITHDRKWRKAVRTAAKKHQLFAFIVRDPLDNDIPAGVGQVTMQDPLSGETMVIDSDRIRERYKREAESELNEIKQTLSKSGVRFLQLSTKDDFTKPIIGFFRRIKKGG